MLLADDAAHPSDSPIDLSARKPIERIARNGWTPESFAADYSAPIRITPTSFRAW